RETGYGDLLFAGVRSPLPRIERVPDSIADEVDAERGDDQRGGGEDDEIGLVVEQVLLEVLQHVAPARLGRRNAVPEKTERGFQQDDAGHAQGRGNDDRGEGIRQDVADDDSGVRCPERSSRLDELLFSKHQKLGPHQSANLVPAGGGDDDDDGGEADTAGRRRDGDDDEQEGRRDDDVGEAQQRVV